MSDLEYAKQLQAQVRELRISPLFFLTGKLSRIKTTRKSKKSYLRNFAFIWSVTV
jgi:hypothetical protein